MHGKIILIVDDDTKVCRLLKGYFERNGLTAVSANNGKEMYASLEHHSIDCIVLDLMLPEVDGFTLCKELRTHSQIPILMLTANSDETDRIVGLELGADDYMEKPFNPRELLARIKAILRRTEMPATVAGKNVTCFAGWQLCNDSAKINDHYGFSCTLSGAEYRLLRIFLDMPHKPLTRDFLSQILHGRDASPFDRSIDVQVSRLRQRLADKGSCPKLIQTVRNKGYMLAVDVVESK